jgi:hypothetical protein
MKIQRFKLGYLFSTMGNLDENLGVTLDYFNDNLVLKESQVWQNQKLDCRIWRKQNPDRRIWQKQNLDCRS